MAEPVERGVVEPVEQREHLAVCRLELGSQLLGRRVRPPSHLAGVPAVGVEVSRHATLAGGHAPQRAHEASLGGRQVDQQVAH